MAERKAGMVKKVFFVLVGLIAVFVVIVALQPSAFRIERSTMIAAPPGKLFARVNDFHAWQDWSPWAKMDPTMKATYEGAPAGAGAIYKWSGNNKVGEGMMTIAESRPTDLIRIKLDFLRPFAASNVAEFTFKPAADGTAVAWAMTGHNGFMSKAVCLFMDMDKVVGADFERGLAAMKAQAEADRAK